ncbi:flagellar protein [Sulfitobacter pontiacus]|jgi:flagellin|uniref:flagellin n=1 Tax=Sulfitobacter pontiacus TaxID=60137 RepID=UPI0007D9F4C2|nr:flagellin [Sulfitobacter pontiacus]OAN78722.1 flagellar protein [Sulfitobacter pontiacus]
MSSILTNTSAMNALSTLRDVNRGLNATQDRVSTGLKVSSGKDNAAYFSISETMKGDSGMFKAINEGMTSTKNSVATARLGAETVSDIAQQMVERIAFAQGEGVNREDVQLELDALAENMLSAINQSTFNGRDLVKTASQGTVEVVNGIQRGAAGITATKFSFDTVDLEAIQGAMAGLSVTAPATTLDAELETAELQLAAAIGAATKMGIVENALDSQMQFVESLTDTLDSGVSSMVDADMEEEAARLQAYQVQQQLATQSLSIANQAPQNILSLFR